MWRRQRQRTTARISVMDSSEFLMQSLDTGHWRLDTGQKQSNVFLLPSSSSSSSAVAAMGGDDIGSDEEYLNATGLDDPANSDGEAEEQHASERQLAAVEQLTSAGSFREAIAHPGLTVIDYYTPPVSGRCNRRPSRNSRF